MVQGNNFKTKWDRSYLKFTLAQDALNRHDLEALAAAGRAAVFWDYLEVHVGEMGGGGGVRPT